MGEVFTFIFGILAVVLIIFILSGIKIIRPYQNGLVERLGKFDRILKPGLKIVVPLLETMVKIDLREQVVDIPPQEVITKDNVVATVDAVVFLEVVDPYCYNYNIANFWLAIVNLAQTNLRNVIGDMSLDESLSSRESINAKLQKSLDEVTDKWGTKVTRVEIKRIEPPVDVTDAMHKQMKAERYRRAKILEAEAEKQSQILIADGQKEAQIKKAEGEAEAIKQVADAEKYKKIAIASGEAQAIVNVFNAMHEGRPTKDLITLKYLESLEKMANGQATKIFMPVETSGVLGSLNTIKEIFSNNTTTTAEKK
ncbi:MAG: SPFH domain-containing protein [Bdellovibrionota bacterium]|nr:SPFH/Band 7/PHB domain protein [Pseudomonadota bacterium]MDY6089723.1 SPFH domain-containing protein [Bdellovibrionota bacterium]